MKNRVYWVDMAKLIAILAVMVDHTSGILYTNSHIQLASFFSVSLFIFVMGVTGYWSYSNYQGRIADKLKKNCWKILRPYFVATFIYCVVENKGFDFQDFIIHTISFNATGPFYYVLLYLQLLIIVPLLYFVLDRATDRKNGGVWKRDILGFVVILLISEFTSNNTNILDIYGGGGKLLGGSYLCLLYGGMIFGKYCDTRKISKAWISAVAFICGLFTTLLWARFILVYKDTADMLYPPYSGVNPPSISLIIYAILVVYSIFFLENSVSQSKYARRTFEIVSSLGKHTLYIFLYHRLILDKILFRIFEASSFMPQNIMLKWIVYYSGMFVGALLIEKVLEDVHKYLCNAYCNNQIYKDI